MVEPNTIIDARYRVLSRLGSGGMADVYLAEDQLLGRSLAVKVLHHHFAEDQEFVERFRREASSAAGLSHPNIVAIFDRGEWDGTYYIAMEYVPGRSLKELVREQGPLEPVVAIDVVTQILQAARFAHARGVIHRDLKPHNVILDEEGRARVTDFGIAQAGASDMTMTGSIMGTAQYLSPEQAQGHAVSAASDLYAVGVILYELLTGAVPFDGDTAVAIAFKQVSAQPLAPSLANPAAPTVLDEIVLRALAKDPAARYGSAEEFIAVLGAARERLPAGAATAIFATQPPGASGTATHAAPAGAALSAGAPPAALLLPPEGDSLGASPDDEDEQAAKKRRSLRLALAGVAAAAIVAILLVLALTRTSSGGKVTVPSVAGQSEAAAAAALRHAGLVPVPALTASSTVADGVVISAMPPVGSVVGKGTRVTIAVSTGPGSSPLPDVAGLTAAQATAKLQEAGFKPITEKQPSATVAGGRVISTDPPAGTEAQAGSSVTVLVSSGPAQTPVPDVVGQSRAAAEATLTNAKLAAGAITQQTSTEQAPGTVLEQSPAAGSSLPAGGTVNLTVAQAPTETAVPDVVGQNEAQASAALGRAGFTPQAVSQTTTEATQVGTVLRQSPAAGHKARKGATVMIAVGVLGPQTTPTTTTPTAPATPTPPAASG
ncbi:MAG TPA: Stk1 family PASTA domain-containing Ser/Thr kinase [Solirubrobacteraceae bacterium]|jgi:serine/threonine-protein kinase|nr:Stk1 family PASTA domain-containing Ser/Thr kinase [Solirubrobacteraceae bacterium]